MNLPRFISGNFIPRNEDFDTVHKRPFIEQVLCNNKLMRGGRNEKEIDLEFWYNSDSESFKIICKTPMQKFSSSIAFHLTFFGTRKLRVFFQIDKPTFRPLLTVFPALRANEKYIISQGT